MKFLLLNFFYYFVLTAAAALDNSNNIRLPELLANATLPFLNLTLSPPTTTTSNNNNNNNNNNGNRSTPTTSTTNKTSPMKNETLTMGGNFTSKNSSVLFIPIPRSNTSKNRSTSFKPSTFDNHAPGLIISLFIILSNCWCLAAAFVL